MRRELAIGAGESDSTFQTEPTCDAVLQHIHGHYVLEVSKNISKFLASLRGVLEWIEDVYQQLVNRK